MGGKKRVLIAENEQDVLQTILKTIISRRRAFYDAVVCVDGYEALDCLKTRDVDLLVLDLHMDNLNGVELCQIIAADPRFKNIPVIISSGFLDESMELQLRSLGVEHFLRKPYPIGDLINKIDEVLRHPVHLT